MSTSHDPHDAPDLGASLARLLPRLAELEQPILSQAGLSMWEYAIVSELASGDAVSQVELSRRTRRDPTRLGKHLDELAARELLIRELSADQRQRTVRLTEGGRSTYARVKSAIRVVEEEFLTSVMSTSDARLFRRLLTDLAEG
ncbi:MarR family winged helix-turn-helix transcriptional regulator [Lysobacter korlensis]|uniref:MarR family winged helix-turn-helix transcriptional regulator n=1 Tax=Lysobacter korlensis TaxID=553636 RepID=A0ABV6RWA1_9GAMM